MAEIVEQKWLKDGLETEMDSSGLITHRESCIIRFDEVVTTGPEAIADSEFEIGQEHRSNINLYLNGDIQANPIDEDTGAVWRFDLIYTTDGFNLSIDGDTNNRVIVRTGRWTYNQVVEQDKETGDAILTPAGDPYDPMPEDITACPVLIITKRENSARMDNLELIGSINQGSITITGTRFPKYCCMFDDYSSNPVIDDQGFLTFENTYTFKGLFKRSKVNNEVIGFKLELLARSFNFKGPDDKPTEIKIQTPIYDEDDNITGYEYVPAATPQMLDINGQVTTTPYYQQFVIHDLIDFTQFGMPSSYPVN